MDVTIVVEAVMTWFPPVAAFCVVAGPAYIVDRLSRADTWLKNMRPFVGGRRLPVIGVGGFLLGAVMSVAAMNVEFPAPPTEYAQGYTRLAFNRIKPGDTESDVLGLIGAPLFSRTVNTRRRLTYEGSNLWFEFDREGSLVASSTTKLHVNRNRRGHEICESDIRALLGTSYRETVCARETQLIYSRCAQGSVEGDHWFRCVILDDTGRVVRLVSQFSWSI